MAAARDGAGEPGTAAPGPIRVVRVDIDARGSGTAAPGPIRVVRVDIDAPLPMLGATREDGARYASAWVIAMRGRRPVGHVEVPFTADLLAVDTLRESLAPWLGEPSGDADDVGAARTSERAGAEPFVSVVVPSTFERVDALERCVAALVAQDYANFEVIVVDNRPEDTPSRAAVWRRLSSNSRVSVVAESRRGISAARNHGLAAATGAIVAFTDDDVEVESGWLAAIGRRFVVEPATDVVTGLVLPAELETAAQIWFERSGSKIDQRYVSVGYANDSAWRRQLLGRWRPGRFHVTAQRSGAPDETVSVYRGKLGMGANMAFRVEALRSIGGFDEALGAGTRSRGGEDLLAISRLVYEGRRLVFDPAVYVFHTHRRTVDELERQLYGYGTGYTAMLTAAVRSDRSHLVGLFWFFFEALVLLPRKFISRDRGTAEAHGARFPRRLARAEFRGLAHGPWAYAAARRTLRRASATKRRAPVSAEASTSTVS